LNGAAKEKLIQEMRALVTDREFKVQVMETESQWKSGLRSRLRLDGAGISLFANASFDSWLLDEHWKNAGGDIVVDECGQTYWTAKQAGKRTFWSLFRQNPFTKRVERVLDFAGCGKIEPREMWISRTYLWIFDRLQNRVLVYSRTNLQIVFEFDIGDNVIDVDLDRRGILCALVKEDGEYKIYRYPIPPGAIEVFTLQTAEKPVAIAIAPDGIIYLLDSKLGRLLRIDPSTKVEESLAAPSQKLLLGFVPTAMQIDDRGVIYLSRSDPAELHVFDGDGSYLGTTSQSANGEIIFHGIELPSKIRRIGGIGFDEYGGIYLSTDRGLAKFSLANNPVGQDGLFYSMTLDNGTFQGLWHRLALHGNFPTKTNVEVYYHASDDTALRADYDAVLAGGGSVEQKAAALEKLLGPLYKGPQIFKGTDDPAAKPVESDKIRPGPAPVDMLVEFNRGRFLWLKFKLLTFDQKVRPAIRSARIYYHRLSYLRYLPLAYREDEVSAAFLERFLSLFETIFDGLDQDIDQLFRYFQASGAPPAFLPWLASWINIGLDEDLPVASMRRLIERAPGLFARKGTVDSITEFLEIYTGRPVSVVEQTRGLKPLILGSATSKLGAGTVLLGGGMKGFRLGDTSVIGHAGVRDRVDDPNEPFLPLLRRFTVVIDLTREEFLRRAPTLRRIVDEQKPTHTNCTISLTTDQMTVGKAVLGVSASVTDAQPYRVGITPLGTASAITRDPRTLRLERGAWIGGPGGL
jgi:phage tail-like protein